MMNHEPSHSEQSQIEQSQIEQLRIEKPHIFPPSVIAGVTERNIDLFPETGFSMLKAQILTEEGVERHRGIFAQKMGIQRESLHFQQQVHGSLVRRALAADPKHEPFIESDGLLTNEQGLTLCVGIADCAGVLIFDPEHKAIAGIHSGWRGTKENIVGKGIAEMQKVFGSKPSSLLVYVSPCASGDCYIVREDVAQYFEEPIVRRINAEEFTFNNRAQIVRQVREAGVLLRKVEVAQGCTMSQPRYHSHRRDGVRAGRMIAFIRLV